MIELRGRTTTQTRRRPSRTGVVVVATATAVLAIAGCVAPAPSRDLGPKPAITQPGRYRDEVFPSVDETPDLVYGNAVDSTGTPEDLALDLYEPSGDTATDRPAIVFIHSGSFVAHSRFDGDIVDLAVDYAQRGYVTVSIDYRIRPEGILSDPLGAIADARHDAQAAVRWLRAHAADYGIAPQRIAAAGISAGAITAIGVGTQPEDPGTTGTPDQPSDVAAVVSLSGTLYSLDPIDRTDAPTLMIHGSADPVVPYKLAEQTCGALRLKGVECTMKTYPGLEHFLPIADAEPTITDFLYRHLVQ